jgi:flagellar FliL protein
LIKANIPQVKSRLIMLLSSKDAEELLTPEGKDNLVKEIIEQVNLPFVPKGASQKVSGVFFTSFVVQ